MTESYSDGYERGRDVLSSMGNDPNGIKGFVALDPVVGPEIDRMLGEFCFGDVWARDGLDLRMRRIAVIGSPRAQAMGEKLVGKGPPSRDAVAALFARHDSELVAPPEA